MIKKQSKSIQANMLNPQHKSWDQDNFIKNNNYKAPFPTYAALKVKIKKKTKSTKLG
jgi:hypothetical protein